MPNLTYTMPRPIRTFQDAITGVTLHQITDCPEGAKQLYFTRCCWSHDGRYFLLVQKKDASINYHVVQSDGTVRQLTHYPAPPDANGVTAHMHRVFYTWELDRLMFLLPAMHPSLPCIVFAWRNQLHLLNLETGEDDVLYTFPETESEMPYTGLHTCFTADGRDLILVTNRRKRAGEPRLDPPDQAWDFSLRDESGIVSKIWRYDFCQRRMVGMLFESNGEQSHLLTCPWDPDLLFWVNYLHKRFYTMRRDGSGLRSYLGETEYQPGHYNWDVANRRMVTLLSKPRDNWDTHVASLDLETGELVHLSGARGQGGQWHQNTSPDGRWIIMDGGGSVGNSRGLCLLDQEKDSLYPVCQLTWGIPLRDDQGRTIKSEFIQHPNPSWSPDGRYVVFSTDFASGIPQVYLADMNTCPGF